MNKRSVDSIYFFKNKPVLFLIAILPLLKLIKIEAKQEIYHKGDLAHEGTQIFKQYSFLYCINFFS